MAYIESHPSWTVTAAAGWPGIPPDRAVSEHLVERTSAGGNHAETWVVIEFEPSGTVTAAAGCSRGNPDRSIGMCLIEVLAQTVETILAAMPAACDIFVAMKKFSFLLFVVPALRPLE
jgi:hypothetical protein